MTVNESIALMVGCGRCGRVLGRAGFVSGWRRGVHQWWRFISLSTAQRHRRRVTVSARLRLRRRWTNLHRLDINSLLPLLFILFHSLHLGYFFLHRCSSIECYRSISSVVISLLPFPIQFQLSNLIQCWISIEFNSHSFSLELISILSLIWISFNLSSCSVPFV